MTYRIDRFKERGIKGAVYDLDGTIADSMGVWQDIYRELFSALSLPFDEAFLKKNNHVPMAKRVKLLKERFSFALSEEAVFSVWKEIVCRHYKNRVAVKPNTLAALKEQFLSGMRLSVATATDVSCCEYFLKEKGISQYFQNVTGLNEVARPKSFPDVYLRAAEKMSVHAEECAVFEDSLAGIMGAKKGGFCVVGVFDRTSESDWNEIMKQCDFYIG